MDGVVTLGEVECKIEANSFKLQFVANTKSLMFRPAARYEARKVREFC